MSQTKEDIRKEAEKVESDEARELMASSSTASPTPSTSKQGNDAEKSETTTATFAMLDKTSKVVQIKEPPVSDTMGYSVVKIEEKHGMFHNAIPAMPLPIAVVLCFLNIAVPGSGK